MINIIKNNIKKHWLAFVVAFIVGLIYIGPHLFFIITNSSIYQGIPLMQVDNEDFYLNRMQEIIDGHPLLGSPAYFEYKDQPPISPPTVEFFYALPTLIFGIPLITTLTISKFVLPLILFLLSYYLIFYLLGKEDRLESKISAMAGAIFITLGYDLVDYSHAFGLLSGSIESTRWLIWTRPVNPIAGIIFLFSFFIFLWSVVQNVSKIRSSIFGAGLFLALMFSSYFFSWGMAMSILAMLGFFSLIKRNFILATRIIYILIIGLVISSPYWYLSWQAKKSIWYQDALLKSGIFYTHYPLLNKVLIASLIIYLIFLFIKLYKNFNLSRVNNRDIFILAFLMGGLFAYNQQIITGLTIWPFHFVQFTIPISIVAMIIVLNDFSKTRLKVVWVSLVGIIFVLSFWFGISVQYKTYVNALEVNISDQKYAEVFNWFNDKEKDCVVLINADLKQFKKLNGLIIAFTHCNQYGNTWGYSLLPQERLTHSLLVNLRIRGITSDTLKEYLKSNPSEAKGYLFSNWAGLYGVTQFPDFEDLELLKRIDQLPDNYTKFLENDFMTELQRYRLDYILSDGPLSKDILNQLPAIKLVDEVNELFIYSL